MKFTLPGTLSLLALAATAWSSPLARRASPSAATCDRLCLSEMATKIMYSMTERDPYSLPLALPYRATENSHAAALGMMTSWRTITHISPPSLIALDEKQSSGYFAADVNEGSDAMRSVLRVRFKVVDRKISELEIFINRGRGDHGFSYSAMELPENYGVLIFPPANRTRAKRSTLEKLGASIFAESPDFSPDIASECQFTEIGWRVVDAGTYSNGSTTPLGCANPSDHPTDAAARNNLVVDEELGFVVSVGVIQGTVFPYQDISAFIPNKMTAAQEVQVEYQRAMEKNGSVPVVQPFGSTGETMEVMQFYDGELQAMQINVYLSGPNMTSAWV